MRLFKAFKFYPHSNDIDEWTVFILSVRTIINNDKRFLRFLSGNSQMAKRWNEVKENIFHTIESELHSLPYMHELRIETPEVLNKTIINVVDQNLQYGFSKPFAEVKVDMLVDLTHDPFYDNTPESFERLIKEREVNFESFNSDLNLKEQFIQGYTFDIRRLLNILEDWPKKELVNDLDSELSRPIITQVDNFDPQVYELLLRNPTLLNTMDWRVFEEMLADILKTFGYSIELTKKTKDGGIDVIAIRNDSDFGSHKYILQAKRYNHAVQVSPVRELLFLNTEHSATKSCLATTSTFTKGAWALANKYQWRLELKDRDGLLHWISKVKSIKKRHH